MKMMRKKMKMMSNSSQVSFFILTAFSEIGLFKYLIFVLILCLYLMIIVSNLLLIVVICINRSLHEPMYLFLCSLFIGELYGASGLFPALLFQILSKVHSISTFFCFLQIYTLHFYGSVEFFTLGVMSYDKYLAICYPLQYKRLMTSGRVTFLTAFVWLYSLLATVAILVLSGPLQLCGNTIDKVYCDNYSIVKLACFDISINNVYGMVYMFTVIVGLLVLIMYSYLRILRVCLSGCKEMRQKARNTCLPHLASLINYSFGVFFEIVQSRFDMRNVPIPLRVFLSLYWLMCQPLFNPLMYGLNMAKIRIVCKSLIVQRGLPWSK